MSITKSKKRRKRKIEKKKNLPVIDPDFIRDNQCWIPTGLETNFVQKTDAWFDIKSTHKRQHPETKRKRHIYESDEMRAENIQLYPTPEQKVKLLSWMETYRKLYNLTITNRNRFINKGFMMSYPKMRTIVQQEFLPNKVNLHNEIYITEDPTSTKSAFKKIYKIPSHSIWNAINDVKKSFTTAKANKDAGNIKSFRLRHKKQSNPVRTFVIEPQDFSKKKNAFSMTKLGVMRSSKPFGIIKHDCRLSYSYITDKFILWKPYTKITTVNHFKSSLIALDPGMRTFQNGYSPDGTCYKIATKKTNDKIKTLLKRIQNVDTTKTSENSERKHNHKKFTKRLRKKVTDMVTDMHWKTANYLCKNFATILVGNMSTTAIVKKNESVLNAANKTYCIALSHYKFRERLLSKAAEHGVECRIVDESYTTQTCGKCGYRNLNVGAAATFRCSDESCSFTLDRDYNAGRNIYLKALSRSIIGVN
jgi:IS605 OrfB family transposase